MLNLLDIKGCTVTIDAMGCQRDIAAKIIEKEGDYPLAVKGNQSHLLNDIKEAFEKTPACSNKLGNTLETGHGRIEKRNRYVIDNTDWVYNNKE